MNLIRRFIHWCLGPYCVVEGCDRQTLYSFTDYCGVHYQERMNEVAKEIAERDFNRRANIIAEGIIRAKERQNKPKYTKPGEEGFRP